MANKCPDDVKLGRITSEHEMKINGWRFSSSILHKPKDFRTDCGNNNTWYGKGDGVFAQIWATFSGSGRLLLRYGSCNKKGRVWLLIKSDQTGRRWKKLDEANETISSKEFNFRFSAGEGIKLQSSGGSIIKINSFNIICKGRNYLG